MNVPRSPTPPHRVRGWLRTVVGAAARAMMKACPARHRLANQDRRSFTRWINHFTGCDLTRLIDRWLDSPTALK